MFVINVSSLFLGIKMKINNIIFYGTPEFAVSSLRALNNAGYNILAVVTTPDKPSGRGLKITESAVKQYSLAQGLPVLQPERLNDRGFVNTIRSLQPDIQIVVAFRKLPPEVFEAAKYGTINLHASLLPNYRGAAPINWAIINGEKETGLTTFFINERIDEGNIIMQESIKIEFEQNSGDLHDIMMTRGGDLLIRSLNKICEKDFKAINQDEFNIAGKIYNKAPKIFKNDCHIDWRKKGLEIYNFIRGLSPYPTAITYLYAPDKRSFVLKIHKATYEEEKHNLLAGNVMTDGKTFLKVATEGGFIALQQVQLVSKAKMDILTFLRGFRVNNDWQTNAI